MPWPIQYGVEFLFFVVSMPFLLNKIPTKEIKNEGKTSRIIFCNKNYVELIQNGNKIFIH